MDKLFLQAEVVKAAAAYRKAEQADTPRLYKGKKLCELGWALDKALAAFYASIDTSEFPSPEAEPEINEAEAEFVIYDGQMINCGSVAHNFP